MSCTFELLHECRFDVHRHAVWRFNNDRLAIGWFEARDFYARRRSQPSPSLSEHSPEFFLHSTLEKVHHEIFAMHENDILRLALPNQLRDALGIGVGRERHVMHLHLRFDLLSIEHEPALTEKQFRPDGIRHAVTRNDNLKTHGKRMLDGTEHRTLIRRLPCSSHPAPTFLKRCKRIAPHGAYRAKQRRSSLRAVSTYDRSHG